MKVKFTPLYSIRLPIVTDSWKSSPENPPRRALGPDRMSFRVNVGADAKTPRAIVWQARALACPQVV
jgi:hypothetical protein